MHFHLNCLFLPNNVFIMSNNNEIKWKPVLVYMFYLIIGTYLSEKTCLDNIYSSIIFVVAQFIW